jgi:hypothetical protein
MCCGAKRFGRPSQNPNVAPELSCKFFPPCDVRLHGRIFRFTWQRWTGGTTLRSAMARSLLLTVEGDAKVAFGHERDLITQRPDVWPLIGVILSVTAFGLALRMWLRHRAAAVEVDGPQSPTDTDADVRRFGPSV